uniref:Putative secreted protein n=1 Tax=Amblyomma americanum TaxID=6943 RepID=A0A0C9SEP6_AMBAM
MQTALVLALVLSVAYVQFLTGDAAPGAQGTEYEDFCDVSETDKIKFLDCIQTEIPQLRGLLQGSGHTPQSLLESICSSNDGENTEDMTEDVARELPAIEKCLAQI